MFTNPCCVLCLLLPKLIQCFTRIEMEFGFATPTDTPNSHSRWLSWWIQVASSGHHWRRNHNGITHTSTFRSIYFFVAKRHYIVFHPMFLGGCAHNSRSSPATLNKVLFLATHTHTHTRSEHDTSSPILFGQFANCRA